MIDINVKRNTDDADLREKMERVKDFRPIDDVFFEVFINDIPCCQEILRTILEDDDLIVTDIMVQHSAQNIYGRAVRLDALCILGNGKKCNIEVQRADNDDHLRRVRFNAASIAVIDSKKGMRFEDVEDVIVVFISQFDIFKSGRTIYHVDNIVRETGECVDDGLERVFVNTEIKDNSSISELMTCFMLKEFNNSKFPAVSNRMRYIKTQKGGLNAMCDVMEKYTKEAVERGREEGRVEGREEGREEERLKNIKFMLECDVDPAAIANKFDMDLDEVLQIASR